jgi:hypothetical protein
VFRAHFEGKEKRLPRTFEVLCRLSKKDEGEAEGREALDLVRGNQGNLRNQSNQGSSIASISLISYHSFFAPL